MDVSPWCRYLIIGPLMRETILPPQGRLAYNIPGGDALYAAAGVATWHPQDRLAIVGRTGVDVPQAWLDELARLGWNVEGVRRVPDITDSRRVVVYGAQGQPLPDSAWLRRFAERRLPMPDDLLPPPPRFTATTPWRRLTPWSVRVTDIPEILLLEARYAHITPLDDITHYLIPAHLRREGVFTVTLEADPCYMKAPYQTLVQDIVAALTAFHVGEDLLKDLFGGLREDLWAMAEEVSAWGVPVVVVLRASWEVWLYDGEARARWIVPLYPHTRGREAVGAAAAMAGGFLWGWSQTEDPKEAAVVASATLSLALETTGALTLLDRLPGLLEQRRDIIKEGVRRV